MNEKFFSSAVGAVYDRAVLPIECYDRVVIDRAYSRPLSNNSVLLAVRTDTVV